MHPHNTEMDLSIAYALYFAARGQGLCTESSCSNSSPAPYTSPARVLLSGLGADELFGGYSRHPSAFQQKGYAGLIDELLLDVGRLGKRNLGRDDRVMAHWGKDVRFPYLDERLVRWAIETPAWEKCDFENNEGVSAVEAGKRVLRLLALELGMGSVAKEKKRAVCTSPNGRDIVTHHADITADTIRLPNGQDGKRPRQRHHANLIRCTVLDTAGGDDDRSQILLSHGRDDNTQAVSCVMWFLPETLALRTAGLHRSI